MTIDFRAGLRAHVSPALIAAAGARLNETERGIARAFRLAIPVIADGVGRLARDPAKRDAVAGLVTTCRAGDALGDIRVLIGGETPTQSAAQQLLELILSGHAGAVANRLGKATTIKSSSAYVVLSVVGVITLGLIAQSLARGPLAASRLEEMLRGSTRGRTSSLMPLRRMGRRALGARAAAGFESRRVERQEHPALGALIWPALAAVTAGGLHLQEARLVGDFRDLASSVKIVASRKLEAAAITSVAPAKSTARLPVLRTSTSLASIGAPERDGRFDDAVRQRGWPQAAPAPAPARIMSMVAPASTVFEPVDPSETGASRLIGRLEDVTRPLDPDEWFDLARISFKAGSDELASENDEEIEILAEILTLFPASRITIAGHTDNTGDPAQNLVLSKARAQAVIDVLAGRGIARDRFTGIGLGDRNPIADNGTPEGRARNRRIAINVTRR